MNSPRIQWINTVPWADLIQDACLEPISEFRPYFKHKVKTLCEAEDHVLFHRIICDIREKIETCLCSCSGGKFLSLRDVVSQTFGPDDFAVYYAASGYNPQSLTQLYWYLVLMTVTSIEGSFADCKKIAGEILDLFAGVYKPKLERKAISAEQPKLVAGDAYEFSRYLADLKDSNESPANIFRDIEYQLDANPNLLDHVTFAQCLMTLIRHCLAIIHEEQVRNFLEKLFTRLPKLLGSFSLLNLGGVLRSMTRLGPFVQYTPIIECLLDEIYRKSAQFYQLNARNITGILWAAAVFGYGEDARLAHLVSRVRTEMSKPNAAFDYDTVHQLYTFDLETGLLPGIDAIFQQYITEGRSSPHSPPTVLEKIVREELLGFTDLDQWDIIFSHQEHGFEFDIVIQRKSNPAERIDIEVDGPAHETRILIDGFRDRILRQLGWKAIIRIPHEIITMQPNYLGNYLDDKFKKLGIL